MFANNRIVTKFYKSYYRFYKNKNNLKNIEKINNPILKIASKSIEQVISNKITPEELKWVEGIKKLRDNLRKSTVEINFENYGAGTHIDSISLEKKGNKVIIKKTIGQICESTVLFKWGLLLFKIVKEFKPKICLELGTCIGISAAYQAAALEMNNQGKIYTIEGASSLVKLAENNLKKLNLNRIDIITGLFNDILPDLLPKIQPIDFAFIDGHHDGKATINYLNKIYPYLSKNAILLFDDINWSKDMQWAWKALENDNRIKFTIDLWSMGLGIITNSKIKKQKFKILIS